MQILGNYGRAFAFGAAILSGLLLITPDAQAKTHRSSNNSASGHGIVTGHSGHKNTTRYAKNGKVRYARYAGLQCVPFARAASGIELKGNAANWWDAAAGVYERGARPESGSVLNFRSNGHMRLGHVAVVTAVVSPREVEIEHANWAGPGANKGGIARGIPVIDVSENNDWSAVRVGLGRGGDYGSVYPTYGFIYDRPDSGTMIANNAGGAPRYASVKPAVAAFDEVAEAPAVEETAAVPSHRSLSRRAIRLHVVKHRKNI